MVFNVTVKRMKSNLDFRLEVRKNKMKIIYEVTLLKECNNLILTSNTVFLLHAKRGILFEKFLRVLQITG